MNQIRHQLRGNGRWVVAIAILVIGAIASMSYILSNQNLSLPWEDRYVVEAEFSGANGLNPGLGQPVNVAGVRVGTVLGVKLENGRALARLEIDPAKLPAVYDDAHAMLVPTTALKDLQIDVFPGTKAAGRLDEGERIPVARTTSPIDADDLLAALDGDTREFFRVLLAEADRGTRGRGRDLRELMKAVGPTARQVRGVSATLAARRAELTRLVHNLAELTTEVGGRNADLARLVQGASATVGALASEQRAIDASLSGLPPALRALRGTLRATPPFSRATRSALTALQPTAERLPSTLRTVAPVAKEAGPILSSRLRPFVREAQPLAGDLRELVPNLSEVTPHLSSAFRVLTYVANELAFNPAGDDEGFLYWLAWGAHNANSFTSSEDAHGAVARSLLLVDCGTVLREPKIAPLLELVTGPLPSCEGN